MKKRTRLEEPFLMVPVHWLMAASEISPSAGLIGCVIWWRWRLNHDSPAKMCPRMWCRFGIGRSTGHRLLRSLADAGLIQLERQKGRCARVTVLRPDLESAEAQDDEVRVN